MVTEHPVVYCTGVLVACYQICLLISLKKIMTLGTVTNGPPILCQLSSIEPFVTCQDTTKWPRKRYLGGLYSIEL